MLVRGLIAVGVVLGLAVVRAGAGEAPGLTEQEAVRLALQHQPMVQAAQAEAAMAGARAGMARSEERLQLSLNALAAASDMVSAVQVPAVMPQAIMMSQDRTAVDLNAMAMLPLATGGRLRENVRAADQGAQAAAWRSAGTRVQVAYEARARFADWRSALAMAKVAADALAAQQRATDLARERFNVGKIPQFDLLRNEAALAAAKQQVTNAAADVAAARARLAQALGVPAGTLPKVAAESPVGGLLVIGSSLAMAWAQRPDLLAANAEVAAAAAALRAKEDAYRPQLYAFGMGDVASPPAMGSSTTGVVGIIVGVPLVNGGRRSAELAEACAAVERAKAMRATVELQVEADVTEAQARLAAASQNLETAAAQVKSAEASYTVAQERYSAGKSTVVELLDAARARTEAEQSLVVAEAQRGLRLADLVRAMGMEWP